MHEHARKGWPRKAVILAAGYGTRMYPLSEVVPKALMPFFGKPMLGRLLDQLALWGVEEAAVNTHHHADQVTAFLQQYPTRIKVSISYEPVILGTGGPLRKLAWFLDDKPFWMMNADMACVVNPASLVHDFRSSSSLASLWMVPGKGPCTCTVDAGRVTSFSGGRPGSPNAATFSGLHLLSPEILSWIPAERFQSIITAYQSAQAAGRTILGVTCPGSNWADIGTPAQYLEAHRSLRGKVRSFCVQVPALHKSGITAKGLCWSAKSGQVKPGAALENSMLWPGARVEASAVLENVIAAGPVLLKGRHRGPIVPAGALLSRDEKTRIEALRLFPGDAPADFIGKRGSERTFFRVHGPRRTMILIRYAGSREENRLYAEQAEFLARLGLTVPAVWIHLPSTGLLVLSDLGEQSLESTLPSLSARSKAALYRKVLDQVFSLHDRGLAQARKERIRLMPSFSRQLYRWEAGLFEEHFLSGMHSIPNRQNAAILRELENHASRLDALPKVLLHRDLQSSNILLHRGKPGFIDFQGMRAGPAVYDLASLLYDPYADLSQDTIARLTETYTRLAPRSWDIAGSLPAAGIQRLCQALGAFGRLSKLPGNAQFLNHIPPALDTLLRLTRDNPAYHVLHETLANLKAG